MMTYIHKHLILILALTSIAFAGYGAQPDAKRFEEIRKSHAYKAGLFMENGLKKKGLIPLHGAFARLWLNRELPEANRLLHEAQQAIIKNEMGTGGMTVEIAGSEHVKWQMRTWNRIYHLFNDRSRFYPGRLDREAQAMIEEMFWLYVSDKSLFKRAGLEYIWGISGSENHEMMHYSNALLAAQAIKDRPVYKDRKLPDGRTLKQHYEAWNTYYKHYCDERAKHGMLIEVFANYNPSYTVPELVNMRDLSEDPLLRGKMDKLLHIIWADWAVGQITGVRGGGRTRLYQGDPDKQFNWGDSDRWRIMSEFFLGAGEWWTQYRMPNHPIHGMPLVMATTGYRLPDVIMDIALDPEGRGEHAYVARRIARTKQGIPDPVQRRFAPWYPFDANDPGMLGYDYCTPDYVIGSLIIDPTITYQNLVSQNRYHAIVFATGINARVVPQCEGLGNRKTYGQQQAVQHENVLLVQRHARARQTGDMRIIYGGKGMRARLMEHNGWMILKEGDAWLGVKGFSRSKPNASCGYTWDNDAHMRMKDGNAPVALIGGRQKDFADLDAFAAYLDTFSGTLDDGWFTLTSQNAEAESSLALHLTCEALPKVNGKPVDLSPDMLFDCPFLQSKHGSGVVIIQKGERKMTIDMADEQ